jgi:hypothetical protein
MSKRRTEKFRSPITAIAVMILFSLSFGALPIQAAAAQSTEKKPARKPASKSRKPVSPGGLAELHSIDELKRLFERDNGKVRVMALLSPT